MSPRQPMTVNHSLTADGRYQTTVATLSRRARDVIEGAFERSVDGGRDHPLVASRLHDFGMRGCTGKASWINVLTLSVLWYMGGGGDPPDDKHTAVQLWREGLHGYRVSDREVSMTCV